MKNNTKLIMENWRKFLKEGPGDEDGFVNPNGVGENGYPEDDEGLGPEGSAALDAPHDPELEDAWETAEGDVNDGLDLDDEGRIDHETVQPAEANAIAGLNAKGYNQWGELDDDFSDSSDSPDYGSYDTSDMPAPLTTNQVEPTNGYDNSDYDSDNDYDNNIEARDLYDDDDEFGGSF
jgi:hypothetical protein